MGMETRIWTEHIERLEIPERVGFGGFGWIQYMRDCFCVGVKIYMGESDC